MITAMILAAALVCAWTAVADEVPAFRSQARWIYVAPDADGKSKDSARPISPL